MQYLFNDDSRPLNHQNRTLIAPFKGWTNILQLLLDILNNSIFF